MNQKKKYLANKFPNLYKFLREARDITLRIQSPQRIFSQIYRNNAWGDIESLSGSGSNFEQTKEVRSLLPDIIKEFKIRSILDIPCGDFNWMKLVALDIEYIGGDIVCDLILQNKIKYENSYRKFMRLDLIHDELPTTDLILCRDCFVHFSNSHILESLKNIMASKSKYLFVTTFIKHEISEDIPTGKWRSINLQKPPFYFPSPIRLLDEKCNYDGFDDKNLGLWKIEDLPDLS